MKTSYFAKYKKDDAVSIAAKHPPWFKGDSYPALFPKYNFFKKYKEDGDEEAYRKSYYEQVLSKLDAQKVYDDLKDKTLLCWEKSGAFCHRRIVAEWLYNELGVVIEECDYEDY